MLINSQPLYQLSYRALERVDRIELTTGGWKPLILPLNYTRMHIILLQPPEDLQQYILL